MQLQAEDSGTGPLTHITGPMAACPQGWQGHQHRPSADPSLTDPSAHRTMAAARSHSLGAQLPQQTETLNLPPSLKQASDLSPAWREGSGTLSTMFPSKHTRCWQGTGNLMAGTRGWPTAPEAPSRPSQPMASGVLLAQQFSLQLSLRVLHTGKSVPSFSLSYVLQNLCKSDFISK